MVLTTFATTKESFMNKRPRPMRMLVKAALCATTFVTTLALAGSDARLLELQTHADFFSRETQQKAFLDPQVFVSAPGAPEATGPQGIKHVAGLRNALVADSGQLALLNASGKSLDMTLAQWFSARGEVILTLLPGGKEKVTIVLSGLKPRGHYSLFENHFDRKPVSFTPLDGDGTDNNFVADASGKAVRPTVSPTPITHDNAILLVYHSDGRSHGDSRGDIGVDAHHQLIARP
jgi:hypothetical protein